MNSSVFKRTDLEVVAQPGFYGSRIDLAIFNDEYVGKVFLEEFAGEQLNAAVSISKAKARKLMDSLWRCGIRPSEDVEEDPTIRDMIPPKPSDKED